MSAPSRCHTVTNWARRDTEIAAELGVTPHTVTEFRRARLMVCHLKTRWASVDWSQRNKEIADALGVSQQAVSYQRTKHTRQTP